MKLADKIATLRKSKGMTQEALAERLNVSRQAVSRWEMGTALPDATNMLQLSRLLGVTADYLLNDDYTSDNDVPKIKEVKSDSIKHILALLVALEIMVLLMQFLTTMILQSVFFGVLSFIPFVALLGGFEYAYQRRAGAATETTAGFRRRFYQISAWLGLYFPMRLVVATAFSFYPRPYASWAFEGIALGSYLAAALLVTLAIQKSHLAKGK